MRKKINEVQKYQNHPNIVILLGKKYEFQNKWGKGKERGHGFVYRYSMENGNEITKMKHC